ncbi:hypothetical protein [Pseudoalteromonas phage J2-1_QLiu-2017]|nr:hypothetical protein [Pseudoalteromonas phage J2-1_QLiu-2017]
MISSVDCMGYFTSKDKEGRNILTVAYETSDCDCVDYKSFLLATPNHRQLGGFIYFEFMIAPNEFAGMMLDADGYMTEEDFQEKCGGH